MCGVRPLVPSSLFLNYFSTTYPVTENVYSHGTPPGSGQPVELNAKHTWLKHLLSLIHKRSSESQWLKTFPLCATSGSGTACPAQCRSTILMADRWSGPHRVSSRLSSPYLYTFFFLDYWILKNSVGTVAQFLWTTTLCNEFIHSGQTFKRKKLNNFLKGKYNIIAWIYFYSSSLKNVGTLY